MSLYPSLRITPANTTPLEERVKQVADRICKSPQQREVFDQAVSATIDVVRELGVEQTVLPQIRQEVKSLNYSLSEAERVKQQLERISSDPANLDDRARTIASLTGQVLKAFNDTVGSRDTQTATQIVRATSYIVWAYATGSPSLPATAEEEGSKANG